MWALRHERCVSTTALLRHLMRAAALSFAETSTTTERAGPRSVKSGVYLCWHGRDLLSDFQTAAYLSVALKWTVQLFCEAAEFPISWQQRLNCRLLFGLFMQYCKHHLGSADFGECAGRWEHWRELKSKRNVLELTCVWFLQFFSIFVYI